MIKGQTKTVYVAMSGGVDSSVAALLLKQKGFRVVGVFMKPWQPKGFACMWQADRQDALRVAVKLGIPLKTWDFSKQYGAKVADPMIAGYRRGITPNPDVDCNRHIKFGLFAARAFCEGADFIATGHYARVMKHRTLSMKHKTQSVEHGTRSMRHDSRFMLHVSRDKNKDQTYFLWGVPERVLPRTLFPIGHLTKPQVRILARRAGLITADKKDSQGVCFVGDLDVKSFLARRIKPRTGKIYHTDGRVLGTHDGAAYYTIGQRHGLDIKDGGGPYFVVRTDVRRNKIVVGAERDLYSEKARVRGLRWFGLRPNPDQKVMAQIRYRSAPVPATISHTGRIRFFKPVRAVTPGQSVVFYYGNRLIGGGIIANTK